MKVTEEKPRDTFREEIDIWENLGPTDSLQQVGDAAACRTRKSGRDRPWINTRVCESVGSRHTQSRQEGLTDSVITLYKERCIWTRGNKIATDQ